MTMSNRGLYIHVPFCVRKCPYCDFYSVAKEQWKTEEYLAAVIRNLSRFREEFDTVYFGGGTPVLIAGGMGEILRAASLSEFPEITAECNPDASGEASLIKMREAGVNRLSFGVQSLDADELKALGRSHTPERAAGAIRRARELGFENISADIMLGVPRQTESSLARTIEGLCGLPITHVSAYMLKIEPNTPFGKNPPETPDDDETADLYLLAVKLLERRGFYQYEISNFAREGFECRHNLKYWRREEYLGIGPSAHSFYDGQRFAVPRDVGRFILEEVQPFGYTDELPDEAEERLMLGLRLREGVPPEVWKGTKSGLRGVPEEYYRIENGRLSLTPRGFLVSNEIIARLLAAKG